MIERKNKKNLIIAVVAALVLQLAVLLFEYIGAVYPLWTGQEITLKTVPIDPRSMFRGNYARLRYDISTLPGESINKKWIPRNGEVIFVLLQKNDDGTYSYKDASLKKPTEGIFIRGRIQRSYSRNALNTYRVRYGIEAYFAPKEKALQIEREVRNSGRGLAKIKIAQNGKAALVRVFAVLAKK